MLVNVDKFAHQRRFLKQNSGKRMLFYATFHTFGWKNIEKGWVDVLIKNVYCGDEKVADHLWLSKTVLSAIPKDGLRRPNQIKFWGSIHVYDHQEHYKHKKHGINEVILIERVR